MYQKQRKLSISTYCYTKGIHRHNLEYAAAIWDPTSKSAYQRFYGQVAERFCHNQLWVDYLEAAFLQQVSNSGLL